MAKTPLIPALSLLFLSTLSGCSEDTQQKWSDAGKAAKEATSATAQEIKEGSEALLEKAKEETRELAEEAQKVIESAKATDPDTGEPANQ